MPELTELSQREVCSVLNGHPVRTVQVTFTHGRIVIFAVPDPAGDECLWRVEDAGVVAVLEAAAEGDGEDGEGQPTVQVLRKEGHDH